MGERLEEVQSKEILEESVRGREGRQGLEKKKNRDQPGEAKERMLGAPAWLRKTRVRSLSEIFADAGERLEEAKGKPGRIWQGKKLADDSCLEAWKCNRTGV